MANLVLKKLHHQTRRILQSFHLVVGKHISWGAATTAEGIAAMISAALGLIGTAGVIAAMGLAPLISLVGNAGGATIYIEEQTLHMAFEPPRRRYLWTFVASTGDSYGPFIINDF